MTAAHVESHGESLTVIGREPMVCCMLCASLVWYICTLPVVSSMYVRLYYVCACAIIVSGTCTR